MEKKKKSSFVASFIISVGNLFSRIVYGKKAESQLADLIRFCRAKKEKLEKEYMAAVGRFPRPDKPSVLKKIFGGKGHESEMIPEDLEKKVKEHDARAKDLKSAKIIQRLFRGNKYSAEKREKDLAKIDQIDADLQAKEKMASGFAAKHREEVERQRVRLEENKESTADL